MWLFAVLAMLAAGASPVHAYEPPPGAVFNVPRPWGTDAERYRIVRTVVEAIRKTRPTKRHPDPVILVSTYLLDHTGSVDALIGACRRGVAVRVILDEDIDNRNSRRLIQALNGDNVKDEDGDGVADRPPKRRKCNRPLKTDGGRVMADETLITTEQARASLRAVTQDSVTWGKDGSYAKKCDGSCRGRGGNMHSKFYAFSRTGKARNVVMVSSSNLNRGGALMGWNDMYVMKERPRSYRGYKRIHREMTDDTRAGDGKVEIKDGPFTSRFFPMRKATKRTDPTLRDLKKIRCTSGFKHRTWVHVSMFYWKGTRGQYIADRLLTLARQGCDVNIIYGAPSLEIAERLRNAARAGLIDLYDSRWDHDGDGFNEVRTHAKYVLVKGHYDGNPRSHQVMTGTQNWVAGSLKRSDENSLNISLRSAWLDYLANWRQIRQHSRQLPYR